MLTRSALVDLNRVGSPTPSHILGSSHFACTGLHQRLLSRNRDVGSIMTTRFVDSVFNDVVRAVRQCTNVGDLRLSPSTRLVEDLAFNGFARLRLVMCLEELFKVELPDEAIKSFVTLDEIARYLDRRCLGCAAFVHAAPSPRPTGAPADLNTIKSPCNFVTKSRTISCQKRTSCELLHDLVSCQGRRMEGRLFLRGANRPANARAREAGARLTACHRHERIDLVFRPTFSTAMRVITGLETPDR